MGREQTALAINILADYDNDTKQGWLNIGIAGHGNLSIGDICIGGKLMDDLSNECFYPPQVYNHDIPVCSITTCSEPSIQYATGMAYDMEAHAFYKNASKFSLRELVQVIKIVSDNPDHPLDKSSTKEVRQMIKKQLQTIDGLVKQIDQASKIFQPDKQLEQVVANILQFHSFSVTRSHQMHDLVKHAKILGFNPNIIEEIAFSSTDAKEAIRSISDFLKPHQILG